MSYTISGGMSLRCRSSKRGLRKAVWLAALLMLGSLGLVMQTASARSFRGEGSDLLVGLGAAGKAMAGAMVASTDDIHASYWNPAGLAHLRQGEAAISRDVRAELAPFEFIGVAFSTDWLARWGLRSTLSLSHFYRLFVEADGRFGKDEFESIFIRLTLPGLPDDFEGEISSKTKEYRVAWAITPEQDPRWRLGLGLGYVDCRTFGCGVRASEPDGFIIQTTHATTLSVHLGLQYDWSDTLSFGLSLRDPDTKLDVEVITTTQDGTDVFRDKVLFPRELTLGAAWAFKHRWESASTLQWIKGQYSENAVDFLVLRQGFSWQGEKRLWRAGLIAPIYIKSDRAGDLKPPYPVAPTLGVSQPWGAFEIGLAAYADLMMSKHEEQVVPTLDFTLKYRF